MRRSCQACGEPFLTKSYRARFCSQRCQKRAYRGAEPAAQGIPASPPAAGGIAEATRAELEGINRWSTVLGQAAYLLAVRMDNADADSGSGLAAVSKELRSVMDTLHRSAGSAGDVVDDLRRRRDMKRHRASGGGA